MPTLPRHRTALADATDEDLVARVRAGDDRAFAEIVDRYEARLTAFARRLLGGAHHDAEEVVQDAFWRALRALRAGDREIALKAWLFTIVRNRALDVLRRPAHTVDLAPHAQVLRAGDCDPYERAVRAEDLEALVDGLWRLPPRQRTALVLHEMGDLGHGAIARELRVSVGGSKALVSRARAGLAQTRCAV